MFAKRIYKKEQQKFTEYKISCLFPNFKFLRCHVLCACGIDCVLCQNFEVKTLCIHNFALHFHSYRRWYCRSNLSNSKAPETFIMLCCNTKQHIIMRNCVLAFPKKKNNRHTNRVELIYNKNIRFEDPLWNWMKWLFIFNWFELNVKHFTKISSQIELNLKFYQIWNAVKFWIELRND